MPLFEIIRINKHNTISRDIVYSEKSSLGINPNGCNHIIVKSFKYEYKHELIPPVIINGENKILNDEEGTILHPTTTLEDINWIKPEKVTQTQEYFKFKSNSSDSIYTVIKRFDGLKMKYTCDCPGVFRSKNKICKHIQSVQNESN